MLIGVTSQNKLKIGAVLNAYSSLGIENSVIGYGVELGISEQLVGDETLFVARDRINNILTNNSGLDRIISIENGIFLENNEWKDKAVVVVYDVNSKIEYLDYSNPFMSLSEYVNNARLFGFDKIRVGKCMDLETSAKNNLDSNLCISDQKKLENVVLNLIKYVEVE